MVRTSQAAWGAAASTAVVQPATGRSGSAVALAETIVLAIIVAVMCRATTPFLPWIMGGMFGLQGVILGTVTGGSANPARQLGPALLAGEHHLLAVYLIAPIVGAVIAARATRKTDAACVVVGAYVEPSQYGADQNVPRRRRRRATAPLPG